MHIALDCVIVGRYPSGVEQAVWGLLGGLAEVPRHDHRLSAVVEPALAGVLPQSPALSPVAAPAWTRWRLGRVIYQQALLPGTLRRLGADLLHGTAYVLPLRWRGPSVLTIHDTVTITHPEWCKPLNVWHYRTVMTRSARRASLVVVPSRYAQAAVIEHVGIESARTRVVPLGVSHDSYRPASQPAVASLRERYGLPERYLLCIGNLEPRKNLTGVIEAFEILARKAPHGLVLAGKRGWRYQPVFQAIRRSPVADRITWLGYFPPHELPALCAGAEALVQWSLDEGFGLPPLEAMACGTPAVISDAGALPEVAGDAALLVPLAAGPGGLADELLRSIEDETLRARLIDRGLRHAAQFTWRRHAERMMQVYEEAAREGT